MPAIFAITNKFAPCERGPMLKPIPGTGLPIYFRGLGFPLIGPNLHKEMTLFPKVRNCQPFPLTDCPTSGLNEIAGVRQVIASGETLGRKVRAPQDTVVGNTHRPRWAQSPPKDRESATESEPPSRGNPGGKGEKVGQLSCLMQEPTSGLATNRLGKPHREQGQAEGLPVRQFPLRVGCSTHQATGGPDTWSPRADLSSRTEPGLLPGPRIIQTTRTKTAIANSFLTDFL